MRSRLATKGLDMTPSPDATALGFIGPECVVIDQDTQLQAWTDRLHTHDLLARLTRTD